MSQHVPHIEPPVRIVNFRNQPVAIAFDVEDSESPRGIRRGKQLEVTSAKDVAMVKKLTAIKLQN